MKRKLRRIFKRTLLTLLVIISALVTIIIFPTLVFANKMKYKNFKVCSNHKIQEDFIPVLDDATALVQESELYDSNHKFNIILCHRSFYNKIDDKLLGSGPAARARLNNIIVKVRVDPKANLAFPTYPKDCRISLTNLIAHEMIHCLQTNKYGIKKFNPIRHPEFWKLEGYPEYISRRKELSAKDYSLAKEIERYINLEHNAGGIWILQDGCIAPNYYFKGRLMVEYLMDIRQLSYDQILKDTISEDIIFKEMISWKDSTVKTTQE